MSSEQTTVACPVTGNPECKEPWCQQRDPARCYLQDVEEIGCWIADLDDECADAK
jgi:hypothetical protein